MGVGILYLSTLKLQIALSLHQSLRDLFLIIKHVSSFITISFLVVIIIAIILIHHFSRFDLAAVVILLFISYSFSHPTEFLVG